MSDLERKITEYFNKYEGSWTQGYGRFSKILTARKLKSGAEIGVAFGGHAENILQHTKVEKLYGVDPFVHFADYDDPMNLPQEEFDALHDFTIKRLSSFGKRYKHVREFSAAAAEKIPNDLDFVYIDADHSYEGVKADLHIWYPKIRMGGVIGGHDYGHVNFEGVKRAIDEFFGPLGASIHEAGEGVWWTVKKSPGISFIMPAYNAEKTIKESVNSIFNGNFADGDELIIVNDCSTDKTGQVLKGLQKKYPQIRIINHKFNKGGGAARNTAIENTRYGLIFCLDSDNILVPGSVSKLREHLIATGSDIVAFGAPKYFKTSTKKVTHQWKYEPSSITLSGALSTYKFPGSSGNYLFTKSSWIKAGRYPEFAGAFDTWGFGIRQLASGSKMSYVPKTFYYHRYGHQSYWKREAEGGKLSLKAFQILIPYLDLIEKEDVNYMMAETTRNTWFDNLDKHPIRLKEGPAKPSLRTRIKKRLR